MARIGFRASVVLLVACTTSRPPTQPSIATTPAPTSSLLGTCPREDLDVDPSFCAETVPEGYGMTKDMPLEWGLEAASRGVLWMNRLACENGGKPETHREGNVGPASVTSISPRSPMTGMAGARVPDIDIVDAWQVRCPGREPFTLYTNMYRCGNPCPPFKMRLIPARAKKLHEASVRALEEKRFEDALAHAQEALRLAPGVETYLAWLGAVYFVFDRPEDALPLLEAARAIDPRSPLHRLHIGAVHDELGHLVEYAGILDELLQELPPDHALVPELKCRKAGVLKRAGKPDEAIALAADACGAGFNRCCEARSE
ncbi:MAG: hypothetical protein HY698_16085 [Deltaproteobacteria bacterium]|nr:hypothetical protein [Deltaproteobacteria bacterium]